MHERCRRICGDDKERCFIGNKKQIDCIADMVINKVFGISSIIEISMGESAPEKIRENLSHAVRTMDELILWVKFLQIAHDLRELSSLSYESGVHEKRRELRFPLPGIHQKYILMKVKIADSFVPVVIKNFSPHGIQFTCPEPLVPDTVRDCILLSTHGIKKEVSFKVKVRYCTKQGPAFVVGVQTEDISDKVSFNFFKSVHDFIMQIPTKESLQGE
ncbi:MAG: PilZ domain-containing protein [Nitrospirae bacterium]|nr:PilZ domain-containing protein [Nitrospirota bacterium]MCL5421875.1 PilZ domain-containing protein [Nitrospirota bacterium]